MCTLNEPSWLVGVTGCYGIWTETVTVAISVISYYVFDYKQLEIVLKIKNYHCFTNKYIANYQHTHTRIMDEWRIWYSIVHVWYNRCIMYVIQTDDSRLFCRYPDRPYQTADHCKPILTVEGDKLKDYVIVFIFILSISFEMYLFVQCLVEIKLSYTAAFDIIAKYLYAF